MAMSTMQEHYGRLFVYSGKYKLVALLKEPSTPQHEDVDNVKKAVIFVGGLGDGFLCCPYIPLLSEQINAAGWSFIQPLLRSSYKGYGMSSIANDTEDLTVLLRHIRDKYNIGRVVVCGHSTGCQDAVALAKSEDEIVRDCLRGVVLQAPASDRLCMEMLLEKYSEHMKLAKELFSKDPASLMPHDAFFDPISASR